MMSWIASCMVEQEPPEVVTFNTKWTFIHGTEVWADSEAKALERLKEVDKNDWFATEMDPGMWEVQFGRDNDVSIIVKAETGLKAAKFAKWFVSLDIEKPYISYIHCPATEGLV